MTIQDNRFINLFRDLNESEARTLYKQLAHKYYLNNDGDIRAIKLLNLAYKQRLVCINPETNLDIEQDLIDHLAMIVHIKDIEIDLLGTWIWVTGDTKRVKALLKQAGFFYAYRKQAWYYRQAKDKIRYSTREYTFEEIKEKYGSRSIKKRN